MNLDDGWRRRALATFALLAAIPAGGALAASPAWTPLGPFGGSIQTLTVSPADPDAVYATLPALGVFKSADGGRAWTLLPTGLTTGNVAVDPSHASTLYVAVSSGVLKSTDGGAHWTLHPLRLSPATTVAVDPARPSRLYAGTVEEGVLRSADGGVSWQPARLPLAGNASWVRALAVPRRGGIVYAATGDGVWKSLDGALTWRRASGGLPAGIAVSLAVAPNDPRTLYASVDNRTARAIYRSGDGGASWRPTANPPLSPFVPGGSSVASLAVSPASSRTVWAGTDPDGLFRSDDGGAHWAAAGPPPARPVAAVAVAVSSTRAVYVGLQALGYDLGGVLASADGGATWARRNQGILGLDANTLALPPGSPGTVWAGLDQQGLFRSANGGRRWVRSDLPDPLLTHGVSIFDVAVAPADPATLYTLAFAWLWRTVNGGATWSEIYGYPENSQFLALLRVDPVDPSHLWGSFGARPYGSTIPLLLDSRDGGESWSPPPSSPDVGCDLFDVQIAPASPSVLYAAGARPSASDCLKTRGSFARSTDGGATWSRADAGLNVFSVRAVAIDPHDPRTVYAATGGDAYDADTGDGVWKSPDGGASWAPAGDALRGKTITALVLSPATGTLWAVVDKAGGVFRSDDGGATWEERSDGLHALRVHRLTIDPNDPNHLYAATSSGIWEITDEP